MKKFGFIGHIGKLEELKKDASHIYNMPTEQCKKTLEGLPASKVMRISNIRSKSGEVAEGILASTWLLPEQYLTLPKHKVQKKILDAARLLEREGATMIGLGGYNSIVPPGSGRIISKNCQVGVTNGNTFTISASIDAVNKAIELFNYRKDDLTVAIIGATGSIGSVITELIMKESFNKVIICARNEVRLQGKAKKLKELYDIDVIISTDIDEAICDSDVVFASTSTPDKIFDNSKFKSGAIICDVAFPHNVGREIAYEREDVFCFDGGLIQIPPGYKCLHPKIDRRITDLGDIYKLPKNIFFACLSETALLTLEGIQESYSLDGIKTENVYFLREIAKKHGFETAPFRNSAGEMKVENYVSYGIN